MFTHENVVPMLEKFGYSVLEINNRYIVIDNRAANEISTFTNLKALATFVNSRTAFDCMEDRLNSYTEFIKAKYGQSE